MLTIERIDSDARDICTDAVRNAINNLLAGSPNFFNQMNYGTDRNVNIHITSGDYSFYDSSINTWSADNVGFNEGTPGDTGTIVVTIPEEMLQGAFYTDTSSASQPFTLDRVLAHEITHVWQIANFASLGVSAHSAQGEGSGAYYSDTLSATYNENLTMNQADGETGIQSYSDDQNHVNGSNTTYHWTS